MNEVSIIGAIVIGILAGWIAEQVMGRSTACSPISSSASSALS
jgi:uncharacterized membrane protein YeaQ/YmgE (transglycosylase-associated protein family)